MNNNRASDSEEDSADRQEAADQRGREQWLQAIGLPIDATEDQVDQWIEQDPNLFFTKYQGAVLDDKIRL